MIVSGMGLRLVAVLAALLFAPAAFAQTQTAADVPTNLSYNFRTGVITFQQAGCGGDVFFEYRYATSGAWTNDNPVASPLSPYTHSNIAGQDYVEVRAGRHNDTPCQITARTAATTYTAVTVASSVTPLDESSLDGAELTVTLGSDHAFGSGVSAASFQLVTNPSVSGLSVSSITGGDSGTRTATLTLGFTGNIIGSFDLKVRVLAAAHNGATDLTSFTGMSVAPDYDDDDDGLIEIATLAQLNAVRWDLDGDGSVAAGNATNYGTAFPNAPAGMGCPASGCAGYELDADLDFDTDGDGDVDSSDSYSNWSPIGTLATTFEGNGHTITRLRVQSTAEAGLFSRLSSAGRISRVGLIDAQVTSNGNVNVGTLLGYNNGGTVIGCYAVGGSVSNTHTGNSGRIGGLVGRLDEGAIRASYSSATVTLSNRSTGGVGGLVGYIDEGTIVASYATGAVSGTTSHSFGRLAVGGLIGAITTRFVTLTYSYSTGAVNHTGASGRVGGLIGHRTTSTSTITNSYWDRQTSGRNGSNGGTSRSTSDLQTPTSATGIFSSWTNVDVNGNGTADEDPWDFGTNAQYPVLKVYGHVPAGQRHGVTVNPTTLTVAEGASATYTTRLNTLPSATVTVTVTSADTDAVTADTDTGTTGNQSTLSFTTANWAAPQTVTLAAEQDDNGIDETVTVTNAASTASMSEYTGLSMTLEAKTVDDETPGFVFDADPTTTMVDEPGPLALQELPSGTTNSANYSVRLAAEPTQDVTVTITSRDPGAVTVGAAALTFTTSNWNNAQTVTLTAAQDDDAKDESVAIGHTASTASASEYTGVMADFGASVDDDETLGVTLSPSPLTVQEQGSATYTVVLDSEPVGGSVTVAITGAASPITVNPTSLAFTASDWDTARTVTVRAADDANMASEMATLTHTASGADYDSVSADLVVTTVDNDTPSLRVEPTNLTVPENGSATYRIRLNIQPTASVTVTVGGTTAEVTADTDGGMTGDQTTLTFDATNWSATQTVTVSAAQDDDATNEMVNLTHAAAGGNYAGLLLAARPGVSVTVDDDDTPAILLDANPVTTNVDEAGPLALNEQSGQPDKSKNYSVRLATEPTAQVTVTVTSGDRAVAVDTDGTPLTRTLTFTTTNWAMPQTVTATAAEDDDASNERVAITHAANGGDYGSVSAQLFATTMDNDQPALMVTAAALTTSGVAEGATATYTVRLATEPDGVATVSVSASGGPVSVDMDGQQAGLQSSLRFDATTWNVARTVVVAGTEDDDGAAGTATLRHTASGADYGSAQAVDVTFAVADNDTPAITVDPTTMEVHEGSTATYTVTLSTAPSGGPVEVAAVSSDDDVATVSPAVLTFTAADWNMPRSVTVSGVVDSDATEEAVAITHTVSGADYGSVTAASVAAQVLEADAPGLRVDPLRLTVREGESVDYRIRLKTQPTGAVTVTETTGSELSIDSDGTPQTLSLTFTMANWNVEQTVTAEAASDDDANDRVTTIIHAVTGYTGVSTAPTTIVRIEDDEAVGVRFDPADGLSLTEGGGAAATGTYTVVLTAQPAASVTVTVTSDDAGLAFDTDGNTPMDQSALTFTTTNWSMAQTVMARAVADNDAATEMATLLHGASGGGYDGVSAGYPVRLADADAVAAPEGVSASAAGPGSLSVRWTASANAQSYLVQWRRPGEAWSAMRQLEVPGATAAARIDGLEVGVRYEVRVVGVNRGDAGEPSSPVRAIPGGGGGGGGGAPSNAPPLATATLADLELSPGESAAVDLSGAFRDPEGTPLSYGASSSDASVASVSVSGGMLRVEALAPGIARVTATATDQDGLSASQSFQVSVGRLVSFASAGVSAREGGSVRLGLTLNRPAPPSGLRVSWSGGADGDPSTADADAADLEAPTVADGRLGGTAEFAPGGMEVFIEISVLDDDDVEPAREYLLLSLSPPDRADWALGVSEATLEIQEGVCDRTPTVRDVLRGTRECWAPTPSELSRRGYLGLHRQGLSTLRAGDLQGLSGLRVLHLHGNRLESLPAGLLEGLASLERLRLEGNRLSELPPNLLSDTPRLKRLDLGGNRLESLPAGLFAGVANLSELNLEGNPGAPFALVVRLARTDAEPWAPAPASVAARVAEGAPFALSAEVLADGAALSASSASVPAGALAGPPLQAEPTGPRAARLSLSGMSPVPQDQCGDMQDGLYPCFRGLSVEAGPPLVLFKPPPGTTDRPPMPTLSADGERAAIALDELFSPSEEGDRLSHQAESDHPDLLAVRIGGGSLVLEANGESDEGVAVVTVTATAPDGQSASLSFAVAVEFAPRGLLRSWRLEWMRGLREAAQ